MSVPLLAAELVDVRSGSDDAPLVVLGPSLGTTTDIWREVANVLTANFRVIRYDLPGHGSSPAATEDFSIAEIAEAIFGAVENVYAGPFYYAGDSLGSAIGLELAAAHPDRMLGLAAFCAGATFGTPAGWRARAELVRSEGMRSIVELSAARWFAPGFLERSSEGVATLDRLRDIDAESYALCCDALAEFDFSPRAPAVLAPTLCVAGEFDIASPPIEVEALATLLPNARYILMEGVGHMPVLENPRDSEATIRSLITTRES